MLQIVFIIIILIINTTFISSKKILVIGGTGRVGSSIVNKLISKGIETNVLVRDLNNAKNNPKLKGAQLYLGDVTNVDDIITASRGCNAIIAAHGVRPIRFTKLYDLIIHPRHFNNHPYNVNYLGTKRILAAMNINNINRLVRITGSLVGKSSLYPFTVMFNILLSKTVKWHEQSEIAIRKSNVDYTIIRPPEITNKLNATLYNGNDNRTVFLESGDTNKRRKGLSIAVDDVAEICAEAANDNRLIKSSVVCGTIDGKCPSDWNSLVESSNIKPDAKVLKPRKHTLSMLFYSTIIAAILSTILSSLFLFGRFIYSKINMGLMI